MKGLLTAWCVLCGYFFTYAQQQPVNGLLQSKKGNAIAYATVLLKKSDGLVVSFTTSNTEGRYTLSLPDTLRMTFHYLEVSCLGYKKIRQQLVEGKHTYDFVMEEQFDNLPEVEVKNRPLIESKGDTLSYDVASFSRKEDRSIGDVIRHMPGMDVGENGQISFNGKIIDNLYIHGDDLMSGSYGLATKTITKEMIKSVDVMQNYQFIKVLQNKVPSDKVVVNLVLKDENSLKLTGQAMLGGGLPEQFDAALNTMLLNKRIKMLNVLKANNSGIDYHDDFAQLGSSDPLGDIGNTRPASLLSAGTAGNPDLPRRNYYLNKSGVLNANNLINTNSGLQFRSNVQVFFDRNTLNYTNSTDNYLANDTIRYNELQNAVRKPFLVNTSFTVMANKSTYYLTNKLIINISGEDQHSYMDFNGKAFDQRLRGRTRDFSNDFTWIPAMKNKNMLNVKWYINYYNSPQRLYVGSGLNSDILNNNQPYAAIGQYAETPTLFSNAYLSYTFRSSLINQDYQAGMINERQHLNSTLSLTQLNNDVTDYTGDAGNALRWQRDRVYFKANYYLKKEKWNATITLPVNWQSIRYHQDEYALNNHKNQFFFNPSASFRLSLNNEDYVQLKYSYNNSVGNISGVYRGTIVTNYRTLHASDADLQEQSSSGGSIYYNFQRSIIMLFANAGINYSKVTVNSILSSVITNNVQRTVLLPYENDQSTLTANAGVSKYLFALKSTVSVKSIFSKARFNQFVNGELLPFNNNTLSLTAVIDAKLFRKVSFNYAATGVKNTSRQQSTHSAPAFAGNTVKRLDQGITLGYSPVNNLFLTAKGRHIYATQPGINKISYLFVDANIRYKLLKWRTDLEFDLTNMTNVKHYEIFMLSSNQFAASRYEIRGRMAIVRATFNL